MNELNVVKYLRSGNSVNTLAGAPYCLKIQEEDNLVLLKYNQIASDFNNAIVRECRGIILDRRTWTPVCFPFVKFFNEGEPYADNLNGELHVYQKVDGSLCKVWYYEGRWRLSSNGHINAAEITIGNGQMNFFGLFMSCLAEYGLTWGQFISELDPNYTYMYEMATQDNQVVIPYEGYHLFYLGQRNIHTYQEEYCPDTRIENVKVYNFSTKEEIIAAASELPDDEEGYVVRDNNWHRVKIKNPTYFMLHKMANNGKPDYLQYYLDNNMDELLAYFPAAKIEFDALANQFKKLEAMAEYYKNLFAPYKHYPRSTFANFLFKRGVPKYLQSFIFRTYDNDQLTWKEYTSTWDYYDWKRMLEQRAKEDLV